MPSLVTTFPRAWRWEGAPARPTAGRGGVAATSPPRQTALSVARARVPRLKAAAPTVLSFHVIEQTSPLGTNGDFLLARNGTCRGRAGPTHLANPQPPPLLRLVPIRSPQPRDWRCPGGPPQTPSSTGQPRLVPSVGPISGAPQPPPLSSPPLPAAARAPARRPRSFGWHVPGTVPCWVAHLLVRR